MADDVFDPRLGPSRMAFPEPTGGVGAAVGGAIALAIGLAMVAMALSDAHRPAPVVGVCLLAAWNLLSLFALYVSVSGLVQQPMRHICDHGVAVVTKQGRVRDVVLFRDVAHLDIVQVVRRTGPAGLRLEGGALAIEVPTRDIADRIHALWQADQRRSP